MSADAGIGGAWGILLSECDVPGLKEVYDELQAYVADEYSPGDNEADNLPRINEFAEKIVNVLKGAGIVVPESVALYWTGSDDDRPARCECPPRQFVLGWGVFTDPWQFPEIDGSFRKLMQLHSWVWMG